MYPGAILVDIAGQHINTNKETNMNKLTQKEYVAKLQDTHFIACCHNVTVEAILDSIATQEGLELPCIYKVETAQLRSKDIVMHYSNKGDNKESGKSYRQFNGTNRYFEKDDLLIHENVQDGHKAIFLNM